MYVHACTPHPPTPHPHTVHSPTASESESRLNWNEINVIYQESFVTVNVIDALYSVTLLDQDRSRTLSPGPQSPDT